MVYPPKTTCRGNRVLSRYIARIIRALFVSCIGFGGGVGLMVLIFILVVKGDQQHAFQYGLNAGLLLGGIFSIFLVCVLLPLDINARLSMSKGGYAEIWDLEQHRDLIYQGQLKEATAMCRQSLLTVPYVKAVIEDPENLLIRASVGSSWRSFGESMEVEINPLAGDKWHMHCSSLPLSRNIAFDYGKNYENVEAWQKEMLKLIAERQTKTV